MSELDILMVFLGSFIGSMIAAIIVSKLSEWRDER
jgi:hypothetical protein